MSDTEEYLIFYKEIKEWILGTLEDEPIDPEINHLYFVLNTHNGYNELQFGGSEQRQKSPIDFDYFPLELQSLYFKDFFFYPLSKAVSFCKLLFKDMIVDEDYRQDFIGKSLYFAIDFQAPKYIFKYKHLS